MSVDCILPLANAYGRETDELIFAELVQSVERDWQVSYDTHPLTHSNILLTHTVTFTITINITVYSFLLILLHYYNRITVYLGQI